MPIELINLCAYDGQQLNIEKVDANKHTLVGESVQPAKQGDDLVEDPFKKRVNANIAATQIPSFDWNAAGEE